MAIYAVAWSFVTNVCVMKRDLWDSPAAMGDFLSSNSWMAVLANTTLLFSDPGEKNTQTENLQNQNLWTEALSMQTKENVLKGVHQLQQPAWGRSFFVPVNLNVTEIIYYSGRKLFY